MHALYAKRVDTTMSMDDNLTKTDTQSQRRGIIIKLRGSMKETSTLFSENIATSF